MASGILATAAVALTLGDTSRLRPAVVKAAGSAGDAAGKILGQRAAKGLAQGIGQRAGQITRAGQQAGARAGTATGQSLVQRASAQITRGAGRLAGELGRTGQRAGSALAEGTVNAAAGLVGRTASLGTRAGGAFARAFGNAAKVGIPVFGALTAAAGAFGLKTVATLESSQIAFETFLGSARKATDLVKQLQKVAANTPFEFTDLTKLAQRLLAAGFAAKDLVPTITAIGDAVAGLGGSPELLSQIANALGQIQVKGKVSNEELLQLAEAGVPAVRILADTMGISAAEVQKLAEQGKIAAKDAIPKLVNGIEKGTKSVRAFGGLMDKQSRSLSGLFSTLKDTAANALANLITPFLPQIKSGLTGLINFVGKAGIAAGRFARDVVVGFRGVDAAFIGLGASARGLDRGMGPLITNIKPLGALLDAVGSAGKGADAALAPLGPALDGITRPLGPLIGAIRPLGPLLKQSDDAARAANLESFGFRVGQSIATAITWYRTHKQEIGTFLSGVRDFASGAIQGIGSFVGFLNAHKKDIANFGLIVTSVALTGAIALLRFGQHGLTGIGMIISALGSLLTAFLSTALGIVIGAKKAFGWIPGVGRRLNGVEEDVRKFRDSVSKGFEDAAGAANRGSAALGRAADSLESVRDKADRARASLNKIQSKTVQVNVRDQASGTLTTVRQNLERLRDRTIRVTTAYLETGTRPTHVPGLGRVVGTLATGVRNLQRGGRFLVGEQGPELVDLPKGANVYNAGETRSLYREGPRTVATSSGGWSDADRQMLMALAARPVVVQLDGREIARVVNRRNALDAYR